MEVRIKDNNGYVDADWTIEDGVMIVSPKVEKFEPKNGDIVTTRGGAHIFLCKEHFGKGNIYAYIGYNFITYSCFNEGEWSVERYATEEEKQKFFEKLKEEGYEWDAEKKEVVKIRWKPKFDTTYYKPLLNVSQFRVALVIWYNLKEDEELYQKGWVFQTNEDCAVFVKKLNQAIEGVKPRTKNYSKS